MWLLAEKSSQEFNASSNSPDLMTFYTKFEHLREEIRRTLINYKSIFY
jgi:hypothetical protein